MNPIIMIDFIIKVDTEREKEGKRWWVWHPLKETWWHRNKPVGLRSDQTSFKYIFFCFLVRKDIRNHSFDNIHDESDSICVLIWGLSKVVKRHNKDFLFFFLLSTKVATAKPEKKKYWGCNLNWMNFNFKELNNIAVFN